jgi:signal transduction protein with GAF and PtsI domain
MIPFCRTPEEAQRIQQIMENEDLVRGKDGLQLYCMAEIPSNIFLADVFCDYFDGFSIGSNDLTQLIYGAGRDNQKLIPIAKQFNYITNSEAIRRAISHLIKTAHERNKKVGICGQAPSDDPEFLRFLVREGIDSISLNFDTYARGRINTWRTEIIEAKLSEESRAKTYQFLDKCDVLIEKIRTPRGKLRNMLRKQRKAIDTELKEITEKFDNTFEEISKISYDFIKELNRGETKSFNQLYNKFNKQIEELEELFPILTKKIREFGIF